MRALPSRYRGVLYRSRVEARWAIFLYEMGAKAQYEPEGFDFDGDCYLPDFFALAWDIYIEVKAAVPDGVERRKCQLLADTTGKRVLLAIGDPSSGLGELFDPGFPHDDVPTGNAAIARCRKCPRTVICWGITFDGDGLSDFGNDDWSQGYCVLDGECENRDRCGDKLATRCDPQIETAIAVACAYRFEVAA